MILKGTDITITSSIKKKNIIIYPLYTYRDESTYFEWGGGKHFTLKWFLKTLEICKFIPFSGQKKRKGTGKKMGQSENKTQNIFMALRYYNNTAMFIWSGCIKI